MFSNLKVIDLSTVLAGPSVATFFAELGATVIKYENPTIADVTRTWKLPTEDANSSISAYFSSVNFGKTYLKLNLNNEIEKKILFEELKTTDILITNFKKGDAEKFSLSDSILQQINPRLIHGKINGFGEDSDRVAYDLILQAESGFMSMNGTEDSGPIKMPVALIDVLAAHHLKEGILLALIEREKSNLGKIISVSLYDAAVCSLVNQASNYLMEKKVAKPIGSLHPNIAPYGEIFITSDHKKVTFAIGSDMHFVRLCHFLGLEYLPDEESFNTNQNRVLNRTILFEILQNEIIKLESTSISSWANEFHVPFGIIKEIDEVLNDKAIQSLIKEEKIDTVVSKRISSIAFKDKKF
ncbi:MAG: CoA transferase [Flavobacteriia bacterium]|nr:CoA transferase [Flavobacteriia bacterium]